MGQDYTAAFARFQTDTGKGRKPWHEPGGARQRHIDLRCIYTGPPAEYP